MSKLVRLIFSLKFFFLLFGFSWLTAGAQTDTTEYFDGSDRNVDAKNAVYYRKISKPDTSNIYLGAEYWMDGHIKMIGHSLDANFLYKIGKFTYFYKNTKKSGEGQYYSDIEQRVFGYKNGKWQTWYADGKPKEEWVYKIADDFTYSESFLMSFWDSTGTQLTTKGEGKYCFTELVNTKDSLQKIIFSGPVHKGQYDGLWRDYYVNGKEYAEEIFAAGKFVKGKSFDGVGKEYFYDSLETHPEFPGGEAELKRFIKLNVQYPPEKDNVIIQAVLVHVFIGRTGFVGNVNLLRGGTAYMNGEALRVAKSLPRFTPATIRGQPVDSYYNVSFDYLDR